MYLVLTGVMMAMLLAMLDQMIVNTALPRIVGDLGGLAHYSWVVTAYLLAATITTPIWGKLGDLYGQKGIYLTAIGTFLAGSVLSGTATSMTTLIAYRAIQGLGAGGLMVGALSIMGVLVPPRERGRYQGVMAAMMPIAMIGGPLLGGFITDHLSWRWAFYVNLPVGAVAVAVIVSTLRLPKLRTSHRVDYLGAALLAAGVGALVLLTTWGGSQYPWLSGEIIGLGVIAVLGLAAFVFVERRATEPIVPLRLFRNRNFAVVSVLGFLVGFAMFGATLVPPQYEQLVKGVSATNSGLALLPLMASIMVTSLLSGQLLTRTGRYRYIPIVGGVLMTGGMLALSQIGVGTSQVVLGLMMVPLGLGLGGMMQTLMTVSQNSVQVTEMGVASSAITFFRSIGGSFGTAIFGAILTNRMTGSLSERLGPAAADRLTGSGQRMSESVMASLPGPVRDTYLHALTGGIDAVFWWALPVAAATFLVAWLVKEVPLRGSAPTAADREPAGQTGTREPAGQAVERQPAGGAADEVLEPA